ncbi:unnamed protein product [Cyprideis torosa]|uniref:Serine protease HTRA2, mitochondrial n=2 Tax=Cyprideis torosa TaxID=163714 RepID=A0A7R8ZIZ8_9CRUS|nr:unnamed protein product [Cyprideis torosa]CAG0881169.1 unnamed protein product [Cyprideis torosa]
MSARFFPRIVRSIRHITSTPLKRSSYLIPVGSACVLSFGYATYHNRRHLFNFPTVFAFRSNNGSGDNYGPLHPNFIADVVEMVAPAVVFIEIKDQRRRDYRTGAPITQSNGSGFIVESDGLILTNAHVVYGKPNSIVKVKLQDGREFNGTIETVDIQSDLATVRIPCKDLPILRLGNSSSLRPGEWVVALGSPLSLSNTITAGVISSKQRMSKELGLRDRNMEYIQTDAAITFGNSGGPLVNMKGEAIGINAMKVTAGISFAIPADHARAFLEKRKEGKFVPVAQVRRYLGITMLSLTPMLLLDLQQRHDLPPEVHHGVLVWKIIVSSPAHLAGIQPGDVVTHIDGHAVHSAKDVYRSLESGGEVLDIVVVRRTGTYHLKVKPESTS